jgi:hypothetical protein
LNSAVVLRSEPEQIRQIAALLQFQDSLAVLVAPTCRVGVDLLAGDDGPDRVFSACCARVVAKSAMVPQAASDNGPPWIAAFLDLVSRLTLASTRRCSPVEGGAARRD